MQFSDQVFFLFKLPTNVEDAIQCLKNDNAILTSLIPIPFLGFVSLGFVFLFLRL